jgi:hypothetical protein
MFLWTPDEHPSFQNAQLHMIYQDSTLKPAQTSLGVQEVVSSDILWKLFPFPPRGRPEEWSRRWFRVPLEELSRIWCMNPFCPHFQTTVSVSTTWWVAVKFGAWILASHIFWQLFPFPPRGGWPEDMSKRWCTNPFSAHLLTTVSVSATWVVGAAQNRCLDAQSLGPNIEIIDKSSSFIVLPPALLCNDIYSANR